MVYRILLVVVLASLGCRPEAAFPPELRHRAEASADPEAMVAALERLERWHRDHDTGASAKLAPGRDREAVARVLAPLGLASTDELAALWGWRDGGAGEAPLLWYHDFLSLDEALAEYRRLRRMPLMGWDPSLLPVFAFQGEWYAVPCDPSWSTGSPVVHVFIEDRPRVVHTNLTSMIRFQEAAFIEGAIWYDAEVGGLDDDIRAVAAVHARFEEFLAFPYFVPDATGSDQAP